MKKEHALKLQKAAEKCASEFSNFSRPKNTSHETFTVVDIDVLSDATAVIIMQKNTGKFALVFAYFLDCNGGEWRYFYPTDSHLLGMRYVEEEKLKIERMNLPLNFKEEPCTK